MSIDRIAVLGGGAWGTALAQTCARAGRRVTLWEHEPANAEQLAHKRESRFLPGVRIDDGIAVTGDLAEAARAQAILLVVPAQALRSVAGRLAPAIAAPTPLIACAKGIEHGTHKFMTEVIAECAPNALPKRISSAKPRVVSAAAALAPSPRPATMPAAIASTFLAAPPTSTPRTSVEW